ncbi:DUF502 domain-containing protein [Desulfolucanica intricata]|uniref:DUF502 domain-containing protein n=1 Tax=Desulfolucanica intricata TaxID=1285191 RepID=UPI0008309975|nr:DUF502 domain-containing protein [Desulfolucanica intricata]
MRKISKFFAQGLLVLLPLAGTIYILTFVYSKIAGLGNAIIFPLTGKELPGIDFILVIFIICLVGLIANWWASRKLLNFIEQLIFKMPGVKTIYSTLKDTMKSLTGDEKKFDTVVLVKLTEQVARLGFLTVTESPFKNSGGKELVGVYFPQTLQVAGDLYWVPRESVTIIDIPVDQALRLIISGGATGLNEENEKLPVTKSPTG